MTNTELITGAIAKAFTGEAPPSFRSETEALAELVVAIKQATAAGEQPRRVCEEVGRACLLLLLCHLQSHMQTEREMALLRDAQQ